MEVVKHYKAVPNGLNHTICGKNFQKSSPRPDFYNGVRQGNDILKYVPISQLVPDHSSGHVQLYRSVSDWQVAPFIQGELSHLSISPSSMYMQ